MMCQVPAHPIIALPDPLCAHRCVGYSTGMAEAAQGFWSCASIAEV